LRITGTANLLQAPLHDLNARDVILLDVSYDRFLYRVGLIAIQASADRRLAKPARLRDGDLRRDPAAAPAAPKTDLTVNLFTPFHVSIHAPARGELSLVNSTEHELPEVQTPDILLHECHAHAATQAPFV
jgi:hypothetical protein